MARKLLRHCHRPCLLPFAELREGRPLQPNCDGGADDYQHTFVRTSFDFLIDAGLASRITVHLFLAPGARVWRKAVTHAFKNSLRRLTGRPLRDLQIIYDITRAAGPPSPE